MFCTLSHMTVLIFVSREVWNFSKKFLVNVMSPETCHTASCGKSPGRHPSRSSHTKFTWGLIMNGTMTNRLRSLGYHGWEGYTGAASIKQPSCSSTLARTFPKRGSMEGWHNQLASPILEEGICCFCQGVWFPTEKLRELGWDVNRSTLRCGKWTKIQWNIDRFSIQSEWSLVTLDSASATTFFFPGWYWTDSKISLSSTTSTGSWQSMLPGRRLSHQGCWYKLLLFDHPVEVGFICSSDLSQRSWLALWQLTAPGSW